MYLLYIRPGHALFKPEGGSLFLHELLDGGGSQAPVGHQPAAILKTLHGLHGQIPVFAVHPVGQIPQLQQPLLEGADLLGDLSPLIGILHGAVTQEHLIGIGVHIL